MSALRLALVVSLAANVVLLALVRWPAARDPSGVLNAAPTASPRRSAQAGTAGRAGPATRRERVDSSHREKKGSTWAEIDSDNFEVLKARLIEAGFPDRVVRDILLARISERFQARERATLYAGIEAKDYWKMGGTGGYAVETTAQRTALDELNRERGDLIKKLFGSGWWAGDATQNGFSRRLYGDLPPEKLARLTGLMDEFGDKQCAVAPNGRVPLPDEAQKLKVIEKEMHDAIAQMLTPAELEQYDLRRSRTANYLGNQLLASFGASESEYRAIYAIYQPFVDQYFDYFTPTTRQQDETRRLAEQQLEPALKAALGDARYADFKQATDPDSRQLNQLVARLDLPLSAARDVAAVQQDITDRAAAVRKDATLSAEQRQAQLNALTQEATATITRTLGAKGFSAFQQYSGQWLSSLGKPPAPPR